MDYSFRMDPSFQHTCHCVGPLDGQPLCPCQMKGGFFPVTQYLICTDPNHAFPGNLYIPPGMGYRHVCPSCGQATVAYGSSVVCAA